MPRDFWAKHLRLVLNSVELLYFADVWGLGHCVRRTSTVASLDGSTPFEEWTTFTRMSVFLIHAFNCLHYDGRQQAGGGGGGGGRAMNKRVSVVDCPALLASRGRGRLGRLMWKGLFQAELNGDGLYLCHHSRNVAQQQRKAFVLSDQQQCVASRLSLNPRFLGSRQACLPALGANSDKAI